MVKVAGVKFKSAGKVYFFDPGELELKAGDNVIVESARGLEFGMLAYDPKYVEDSEIVAPLKPVIRIADENDVSRHEENLKKKEKALSVCQEKIEKHGLDMKLVDVECNFEGNTPLTIQRSCSTSRRTGASISASWSKTLLRCSAHA